MTYNWQQAAWPKVTVNKAALREELKAFETALGHVKQAFLRQMDAKAVAVAMVDEAIETSSIEGVRVDETVVMSSICKALGMPTIPLGFARDARSEGVAQMVLAVKRDWHKPIGSALLLDWHKALLANDNRGLTVGAFRKHPVQVIRRNAYGEAEVMFEAPPSEQVPREIAAFCRKWRSLRNTPATIALKAALLHPHFESIHPFDDGNGRVGRALVAKALAEGLGMDVVLPVSTVIMRHRKAYYREIHLASQSLDWTNWAKFFIPILTETLIDFVSAAKFVTAKSAFLVRYEQLVTERARKVFLRLFRDGPKGVAAGLSAAKWMRMTKVSKPTATRDLAELVSLGAIIPEGESVATHYRLNFDLPESPHEPLSDPINDPIKHAVLTVVEQQPGCQREQIAQAVGKSVETVKRAIAALIAAGRIEHRGSKKTGGYFAVEVAQ
ncbi:MAG: DUF4172 domain-containing protein [Candidatus Spyradenecus sp.]